MNGYSKDGYIIDQDYFTSYTYRGCQLCHNGCGPIAVYNLLKYLNKDMSLEEIITELESSYIFNIPGPTTNKALGRFLHNHLNDIYEACNKSDSYALMQISRAGIIRYNESGVPHLVCFIKSEDKNFRFFNVEDGYEDYTSDLDTFFKRILPGFTYTYSIK